MACLTLVLARLRQRLVDQFFIAWLEFFSLDHRSNRSTSLALKQISRLSEKSHIVANPARRGLYTYVALHASRTPRCTYRSPLAHRISNRLDQSTGERDGMPSPHLAGGSRPSTPLYTKAGAAMLQLEAAITCSHGILARIVNHAACRWFYNLEVGLKKKIPTYDQKDLPHFYGFSNRGSRFIHGLSLVHLSPTGVDVMKMKSRMDLKVINHRCSLEPNQPSQLIDHVLQTMTVLFCDRHVS